MKKLFVYGIFAIAAAVPALSFAQSAQPVTRAQVQAELTQLEHAGYQPTASNKNYPNGLVASESKIAMSETSNRSNTSPEAMRSVGGVPMTGHSASGARTASQCVGPASYCIPYFGS